MRISKLLTAALLLFSIPNAFAQRQIEKKRMFALSDTNAKTLGRMYVTIDTNNNFCFHASQGEGAVITNSKIYGPFAKQDSRNRCTIFYNTAGIGQYIKGKNNTTLLGPYDGEIEVAVNNGLDEFFAYTVSEGNNLSYYINGALVTTVVTKNEAGNRWCTFSSNGNALYAIGSKEWNYLFLNGKVIDSSQSDYSELAVDDELCYRYSLGWQDKHDNCCSMYKRYRHAAQKVFGPVARYGSVFQGYDDCGYFYGNGQGKSYRIESDSIYVSPPGYRNVMMPGKGNNFLIYANNIMQWRNMERDVSIPVILNGKAGTLPYSAILSAAVDSLGHYALLGAREYYTYKNIDGVEQKKPLSKHGVRAAPISIDARGNTICYYQTDDTTYVYENDRLFTKCANDHFKTINLDEVVLEFQLPDYPLRAGHEPFGFCAGGECYIVYNNTISPPILKLRPRYWNSPAKPGDIIASGYSSNGYWVIQKAGVRKYRLLINNRIVPLPENVDLEGPLWFALSENFRLTDKVFTLFTREGTDIWRYKITL